MHQIPIYIDVVSAKKYLGDLLGPVQREATDMIGTQMMITPSEFTVQPSNPTNIESLAYRKFLKRALSRERVILKVLSGNKNLAEGTIDYRHFEALEEELEFLEKIITIEKYFNVQISILRQIRSAKVKDLERIKAKAVVLDKDDEIKISYISADKSRRGTYIDVIHSE